MNTVVDVMLYKSGSVHKSLNIWSQSRCSLYFRAYRLEQEIIIVEFELYIDWFVKNMLDKPFNNYIKLIKRSKCFTLKSHNNS